MQHGQKKKTSEELLNAFNNLMVIASVRDRDSVGSVVLTYLTTENFPFFFFDHAARLA